MRSAGVRFLIVGLLVLLMFIPLFFVGAVIDSRANYSRQAVSEVGEEWGGPQLLSGPVLVIPVEGPVTRTESRDVTDPVTGQVRQETYEVTEIRQKPSIYILPEAFAAEVDTATVPGHGYETARCAGHAAILNPLAASVSRAFCSALI